MQATATCLKNNLLPTVMGFVIIQRTSKDSFKVDIDKALHGRDPGRYYGAVDMSQIFFGNGKSHPIPSNGMLLNKPIVNPQNELENIEEEAPTNCVQEFFCSRNKQANRHIYVTTDKREASGRMDERTQGKRKMDMRTQKYSFPNAQEKVPGTWKMFKITCVVWFSSPSSPAEVEKAVPIRSAEELSVERDFHSIRGKSFN
ncbi:hypothetical protein ACLOJK_019873 [Asimina triloba]